MSGKARAIILWASVAVVMFGCGNAPEPSSICTPDPDIEPKDCHFVPEGEYGDLNNRASIRELCNSPCTRAGHLLVSSVEGLKNLEALSRLKSVQTLTLARNSELRTTAGLELEGTVEELKLEENDELRRLEGFEDVDKIQTVFAINNDRLKNIDGLADVGKFDGLQFQSNNLRSLEALRGSDIEKFLAISGENSLKTLKGIPKLEKIISVDLQNNSSLTDVSALTNIGEVTDRLVFFNNTNLKQCHIEEVIEQIDTSQTDDVTVVQNAGGTCE